MNDYLQGALAWSFIGATVGFGSCRVYIKTFYTLTRKRKND